MLKTPLFFVLIFSLSFTSHASWEAPVAGTVAGFQVAGPKGAALGLLVGCADEIFVSTGLFEKRYLASGALGAGLLQPMGLSYHIHEGIGFLVGLLFATGHLTPWLDSLITPAANGLMGASLAGSTGALGGLVCSGIDSFLMQQNSTSMPVLGMILQGISGANAIGTQFGITPGYSYTAGVGLAAILMAQDKPLVQTSALELGKKLYNFYARLMDPQELDRLIEGQILAMVSSSLAINSIGAQVDRFNGLMENAIVDVAKRPEPFFKALKDFSRFLIPYFAVHCAKNQVNEYLNSVVSSQIENKVFDSYLLGEAPLKIGLDNRTQTAVSKLRENTQKLCGEGNRLLGTALQTGTGAVFHVGILLQKDAFDLMALSNTYQSLIASLSVYLQEQHAQYRPLIDEENKKIQLYDVAANTQADLIVPYDRLSFLKNKSAFAVQNSQRLQYNQAAIKAGIDAFKEVSQTAESILRYALIGQKIRDQKMKSSERTVVFSAGHEISQAFSWATQNRVAISEVEQQISEVSKVLDAIQKVPETNKPQLIFKTIQGPELIIELNHIRAGLEKEDTKLTLNNLVLKKGVYAVTGPSGSGKTTFLKKLKGLQHGYGWAEGEVTYQTQDGQFPKLTFISQKDYLMPYSSLIEILLSKTEYSEAELVRVQELVQEIGLNKSDLLVQKANWEELSGGERKKISVISAIMQNPSILILDEVFTGLDPKSLETVQTMFKKHLPNTLFLVVEQQLEANNRLGFYDYDLRLFEGKIVALN